MLIVECMRTESRGSAFQLVIYCYSIEVTLMHFEALGSVAIKVME